MDATAFPPRDPGAHDDAEFPLPGPLLVAGVDEFDPAAVWVGGDVGEVLAGCDQKAEWCQADHSISWKAHGCTVPRNGGPLCRRHNLFKEQGYRVCRDDHGNWHTHHPDGTEIL